MLGEGIAPLTATPSSPPHKHKSWITKDPALFRTQPHPHRGHTPSGA
jgi:hypothetical protein